MTATTLRDMTALHYECHARSDLFVVEMSLPLYAVMWLDDAWARALAALPYVRATHVERRDGRPVTLAVTVDDSGVTAQRADEMRDIVRRVYSREMGQ